MLFTCCPQLKSQKRAKVAHESASSCAVYESNMVALPEDEEVTEERSTKLPKKFQLTTCQLTTCQ